MLDVESSSTLKQLTMYLRLRRTPREVPTLGGEISNFRQAVGSTKQ